MSAEPPRADESAWYWRPAVPIEELAQPTHGPELIAALADLPALRLDSDDTVTATQLREWYEALTEDEQALFSHYKTYGSRLDLDEDALPLVLTADDDPAVERMAKAIWSRFPYAKFRERKLGTAGLVWVLDNRPNVLPPSLAVKTPNPAKEIPGLSISALSQRELRLWRALPGHINVVRALGFGTLADGLDPSKALPFVWMPCADRGLSSRVGELPLWDALWLLGQSVTGLAWLYENGFEGHGDIKPDNVLLTDEYYSRFSGFPSDDPRLISPVLAQISDLGWADAWRDLGMSTRAWRPYLAPERIDGVFVPEASDMFSVGVLITEVVTGLHPAGVPTERVGKKYRSDGKWSEWVAEGVRKLDGLPNNLRDVVSACLDHDPDRRPSARQVLLALTDAAAAVGPSILDILDLHTEHARAQKNSSASATVDVAHRLAALGGDVIDKEIVRLEGLFSSPEADETSRTAWNLVGSWGIAKIRALRGTATDSRRVRELCLTALEVGLSPSADLDLRRDWTGVELSDEQPEEALLDFLSEVARLLQSVDSSSADARRLLGALATRRAKFNALEREALLKRLREPRKGDGPGS